MDTYLYYFYLVYAIILYIFSTIIRDRKLFPVRSSGMLLLLSLLLAFFGSYLFIRSLGSGHQYGSGTCGPDGCTYNQSLIFTIDEILFYLFLPLTLFTVFAALLMVLAEIPRLKTERLTFDGAGIVFAGGLMFLNIIIGGYPALKLVGSVFFIMTLFLLAKAQKYRAILGAVATMYLYPLLYW